MLCIMGEKVSYYLHMKGKKRKEKKRGRRIITLTKTKDKIVFIVEE